MTQETDRDATERRERWRNENWTRFSTQEEQVHAAIEYGEVHGRQAERAAIVADLRVWAGRSDTAHDTVLAAILRGCADRYEAGAHTEEE